MSKNAKVMNFEEGIAKLETIVKKMEDGAMSLDESLEAFEEGVKLSKFCGQKLEEAQRRVNLLMEKNGKLETAPFGERDDDL